MPGFRVSGDGQIAGDEKDPLATLESARRHRWRITVLGAGQTGIYQPLEDIIIYAFKGQRPAMEIDKVTIHHGQDEAYFPGKNRWSPVNFSFYEVLDKDGRNMSAIALYGWQKDVVIDLTQSLIRQNCKRQVVYQQYLTEPVGDRRSAPKVSHEYALMSAWPSKITPDELDYSSSEVSVIQVTLTYDKAVERTRE